MKFQRRFSWKTLAVLLAVLAAGMTSFRAVRASNDTRSWGRLCSEHVYTRQGWICLESLPEASQEGYRAYQASQAASTPEASQGGDDRPLPATRPDEALASLPYHYLEVLDTRVPLYTTLDAAVNKGKPSRHLIPGFDYVAFNNQVKVGGKWYYRTASGFWMPGRDAAYLGQIPSFQGLVFERTPQTDFGWVLHDVESQGELRDEGPEYTGERYQRYDVVRIFAEKQSRGMTFLRIGEGEWLPARSVGRVSPRQHAPDGVDGQRWIDINLGQQTLAVYEGGDLVFATLMSSGIEGNWTRPGTFQIDSKKETELMRGSFAPDRSDYYYLENVPWTMYFDQARALHGTYWHDSFGSQQSKGCVNLSPGDAHWLFKWADVGDWVHVYDPSGETPTDPDAFHTGGA